MTPIRNCSVNTELIDRVNFLEQEFSISIEVNGTSAFPVLQDPMTQSAGAFEDRMTSLFESLYILSAVQFHCPYGSWESPYHLFPDPGPRNVQCPCKKFMA